jgi:hypothetical protein
MDGQNTVQVRALDVAYSNKMESEFNLTWFKINVSEIFCSTQEVFIETVFNGQKFK